MGGCFYLSDHALFHRAVIAAECEGDQDRIALIDRRGISRNEFNNKCAVSTISEYSRGIALAISIVGFKIGDWIISVRAEN